MEKSPSSNYWSCSSRSNVSHRHQGLTDSELIAAKQLMQLSDENNSSSSCGINNNIKNKSLYPYETDEEGLGVVDEYESRLSVISCAAKIEEIFGKEDDGEEENFRPIKKYRSFADIYRTTKPINRIKMNASTSDHHRRRSCRN